MSLRITKKKKIGYRQHTRRIKWKKQQEKNESGKKRREEDGNKSRDPPNREKKRKLRGKKGPRNGKCKKTLDQA